MPTDPPPAAASAPAGVVARRTARGAVRSAALWGYVFGATVAFTALSYASTYPTAVERRHLATLFGSDTGLAAINGPARSLQTVAGFTAWKVSMFLMVVGCVWGLLTATRLLRGEEDAGRWELLLAGRTTQRRATAQAIGGLAVGLATLWAVTAVVVVAVGQTSRVAIAPAACLLFALSLAAGAAMFLAVGAVTSQVAATRPRATGYGAVVLGASYALRLVADSGSGLQWLRWASPLGWVEELQPLTAPRPVALVPVAALTVCLAALAVPLAGRRDLGAGLLADRATGRTRRWVARGPTGLAVVLLRPAAAGWAASVGAMALLMGYVAKQGGKALTASSSFAKVAARLGVAGGGAADYLGFAFLIVALLVALVAVGQVGAARTEEADGHLDNLVVRHVARTRWLGSRAAIAGATVVVLGVLAGVSAWLGAAAEHAGLGFGSVVAAGANVAAPSLCLLGVGLLTLGWWPRATTAVAYGVVSWSLLIELVAGISASDHWLLDTSLFHQMAAAPAVPPDWASAAVMVAIGLVSAAAGALGFRRRDLVGA